VVLNTIAGMSFLMNWADQEKLPWSHFLFLSASHYPLTEPRDLLDLLSEFPQTSFGHFESLSSYTHKGDNNLRGKLSSVLLDPAIYDTEPPEEKLGSEWHPRLSSMRATIAWPVLPDATMVKGEAWMILSYEFCSYVISDAEAKRFLVRLATVHAPDEWYFQNLLVRSPLELAGEARNDHLHYIVWQDPRKGTEAIAGSHPVVLDSMEAFWSDLSKSGALFARKFSIASTELLDRIDQNLRGNPSYLSLVRQRMSKACDARDQRCRDTRWLKG